MNTINKKPKVSVSMRTYNHEKFIAQAIESVLMQKVSFDYEIVIGEDCSTDKTREIVLNFQKRYPDKIRLLLPEKNIGRKENFVQTLKFCQGDYVALLDGDDQWTSPDKLQKQVDFLDSHPECSACFHNVNRISEEKEIRYLFHRGKLKNILTLKDLLHWNFIPTCSVMFRNNLFGEFPAWFSDVSFSDWPLHIMHAQQGDIGYIDEVMAVSRIRWSSGAKIPDDWHFKYWKDDIKFYEIINAHLEYKYNWVIKKEIFKRCIINKYISQGANILLSVFPNAYRNYRNISRRRND